MEAVVAFLYTVGDFIIATVAGEAAVLAVSATTSAVIGATAIIGGTVGLSKLFEIEMNVPDTDYSRQRTVKGGTQPVKTVYGEALVSGPIAFLGAGNSAVSSSGNESLYHVIALTGHQSESITDIYFDNVKIQSSDINGGAATGGAVSGSTVYGPVNSTTITYINKHLGADTSADSMVSAQFAKWTSDHVGQGVTYIATQFYFPDDSDIADVWNKHTPSDIKALVKGVKTIYDPRDDTGGNGAAPGNSSFQSWSDNPALCLADYMTNTEWGMGIPTSKVDWDAVADAADYCDELQSIPGSATQKRFTCNGVLFGTEAHQNNVSKLLSSMNGSMVYTGGKYVINAGQYIAPGVDDILTEDDLNGHVTLTTSTKRSDRFNTITGVFNDPDQLHKQVEFPKVQISSAVTRDNSEVLTKQIQLSMTNNVYMAQRLAYQMIKRSNDQMVLDFPANLKGLRVAIGDRVKVTINQFAGSEADPISFVNKVFVCTNFSFTDSNAGGVNLTLVEDTEANYYDATVTPALIMPVAAYSSVDLSDGSITDGFRGVPAPSSLSAVGVAQGIALTWTNPLDPLEFDNIKIYRVPGTASTFVSGDVDQIYYTKNNFYNIFDITGANRTFTFWIEAIKAGSASSKVGPDSATAGELTADSIPWTDVDDRNIGVSINASDEITLTGVDTDSSDATGQGIAQSGVNQGITTTSGGVTFNEGGSIKTTGKDSETDTTAGFFLGYNGSNYTFAVGDANNSMTWNGSKLRIVGGAEVDTLTVNSGFQLFGEPFVAHSVRDGAISADMLSEGAINRILGSVATATGSSNGDYKTGNGSYTTSGGSIVLGTSGDLFDHASLPVELEANFSNSWFSTTNYNSGSSTNGGTFALAFEVSTDGTNYTSAHTATINILKYDLSSLYGTSYYAYYVYHDETYSLTTSASGSGTDLTDDTDVYIRCTISSVGDPVTGQTLSFSFQANEGVKPADTVTGDLTVTGNLTVQGTTTTIDSATLNVEDKNITINYASGDSSSTADGAGITIQDAVDANTDATILWDQTNSEFDFSHDINLNTKKIRASMLHAGTPGTYFVKAEGSPGDAISVSGNITATGSLNGTTISAGGNTIVDVSQNLQNIGTISSGQITSTINTGIGIRTTYGLFAQFATDSQIDIVSSGAGTWGSAINLVEGNDTSNTDVWSIARKTTGGDGDSSLHFNFGTDNDHDNTNRVLFSSSGAVTASGLVTGAGVLGDPYLQTKGADGAIAVYIDSKSSFDGTNTLNAPMIEWRESDGTNIAGIRGYVDTSGNKLALGTGFFDEELTITSSGISVAGGATFAGDTSVYTGASTGSFNVGRSSAQRLNFYVTDGLGYIRYYQDETDTSDHSLKFEIQSSSSGTNQFYFNKGVNVTGGLTASGAITSGKIEATTTSGSNVIEASSTGSGIQAGIVIESEQDNAQLEIKADKNNVATSYNQDPRIAFWSGDTVKMYQYWDESAANLTFSSDATGTSPAGIHMGQSGAFTADGNGTFNGGTLTVSSGTSGDSFLIIESDTDNNEEGDHPAIYLKQDGGIVEGVIRLEDNHLEIISNVSSAAGIRFLTGSTNNYTTDPSTGATTAVIIDGSQNVDIVEYLRHMGDTDTNLRFQTDRATLTSGGGAIVDAHSNGQLYLTGSTVTVYGNYSSTGTITSGAITASNSDVSSTALIIGSSSQTNFTLQRWMTSAHTGNEAYIIAYGADHTSEAGNFAIKNVEPDSDIFFEVASNIVPLRLQSTGNAVFAGKITSQELTITGGSDGDDVYINNTSPTLAFTDSNSYSDSSDKYIIRGASTGHLQFQFYDDSANTTSSTFLIDESGNSRIYGTLKVDGSTTILGTTVGANHKVEIGERETGRGFLFEVKNSNGTAAADKATRMFMAETGYNSGNSSYPDNYGLSLVYEGMGTTTFDSGFVSTLSNGQWGLYGHYDDSNGTLILQSDREGSFFKIKTRNRTAGDTDTIDALTINSEQAATFASLITATHASFTTTNSTAPSAEDLNVSGYGIIGNRTSPVYVHNNGTGGVRISGNATLGNAVGVLINDTSATFAGSASFAGNITTTGTSITVDPASGDAVLFLQGAAGAQTLRLDQNSIRTSTNSPLTFLLNSSTATQRFLTSGNTKIGSGVGATERSRHLTVEGSGDLMALYSTNDGAGGAQLDFIQNSSSKASNDAVGIINFSSDARQYSSIRGLAANHTTGLGEIRFGLRLSTSSYDHDRFIFNTSGADFDGTLTTTGNISINAADGFVYLNNIGTGNSGIYVRGITSSGTLRSHSTDNHRWEISGSQKMELDSTGQLNVVGNLKADYSLLGRGPRSANRGELHLNATSASDVSEIFFGFGDGYTDGNIRWGISDRGSGSDKLIFYKGPYHGGFASVMELDASSSNVKINSTSNSALLVYGNGAGIHLQGGNNRIWFSDYRALEGSTDGSVLQIGETYTNMRLQTTNIWAGDTGDVAMTIGYNGNTGTVTSGKAKIEFCFGSTISQSPQIRLSDNGGDLGWTIGANDYDENALIIHSNNNGTPPDIEVNQSYTNYGFAFLPSSKDFYASGNITAYSDRRIKDNIETIDNALERVMGMRGVFYTRKDLPEKGRQTGVIAQEMQEQLPEVVIEDSSGRLSVSYGNVVGTLIEAIKTQQEQIEDLKQTIEELKHGGHKDK